MNHGSPLAGDAYKVPWAEVTLAPHLDGLRLQIFSFINESMNILTTCPRAFDMTGVEQSIFVFLKIQDWLRVVVLQISEGDNDDDTFKIWALAMGLNNTHNTRLAP